MSEPTAPPPKRSTHSFFIWWKPDPAEVQRQVSQYQTLKIWQSARGLSVLCCAFSVIVTVVFSSVLNLTADAVLIEVVLWAVLGLFMYLGHKWAFVLAMILWTYEKGALLVEQTSAGHPSITQVIWWFIYMGVFYLGFTVERSRVRPSASAPFVADELSKLAELRARGLIDDS